MLANARGPLGIVGKEIIIVGRGSNVCWFFSRAGGIRVYETAFIQQAGQNMAPAFLVEILLFLLVCFVFLFFPLYHTM